MKRDKRKVKIFGVGNKTLCWTKSKFEESVNSWKFSVHSDNSDHTSWLGLTVPTQNKKGTLSEGSLFARNFQHKTSIGCDTIIFTAWSLMIFFLFLLQYFRQFCFKLELIDLGFRKLCSFFSLTASFFSKNYSYSILIL